MVSIALQAGSKWAADDAADAMNLLMTVDEAAMMEGGCVVVGVRSLGRDFSLRLAPLASCEAQPKATGASNNRPGIIAWLLGQRRLGKLGAYLAYYSRANAMADRLDGIGDGCFLKLDQ